MENANFIKFLGTAGTRFVVARQLRSSAGVFINVKGKRIILDPGPGSLVKCAASKPRIDVGKIDAIILTHVHIDHSNDVNILIDAMTDGGFKKQGVLFTTDECLNGENAVVLRYLRDFLQDIVILKANCEYRLGELKFRTSVRHEHPAETYGIIFDLDDQKKISFLVDTRYFPDLAKSYAGSSTIIMNVPIDSLHDTSKAMHLCLENAKQLISQIQPEQAILTHFGLTMLRNKPWEIARKMSEELGIKVIAAWDGMKMEL